VVAHHDPGVNASTGLFARLRQRSQPQLSIPVISVNITPLVATRHHVVSGAAILNANVSGHRCRYCAHGVWLLSPLSAFRD
jgi:hypothetical protein